MEHSSSSLLDRCIAFCFFSIVGLFDDWSAKAERLEKNLPHLGYSSQVNLSYLRLQHRPKSNFLFFITIIKGGSP